MINCKWRAVFPLSLLILHSAVTVSHAETEVLANAVPDECWSTCGGPYVAAENGACPIGTIPKRNQAYVWGLAKWKDKVWIGTGANIAGIGQTAAGGLQDCVITRDANGNPINVLEGGMSQYPGVPALLRPFLGDWRPPQVWIYDTVTRQKINVTPNDPLINETLGLRSAGVSNGLVILAGPGRLGVTVNMFAFDADANPPKYLGSRSFIRYSNIRKFVSVQNVVYTGVQTIMGSGEVLRWTGTKSNPFSFTTVGLVDNDAVNLTEHEGRLFVSTWRPSTLSSSVGILGTDRPPAGIWMSPPIPDGGLRILHAGLWTKVWEVTDYEPDEVIASTQGVGDLASFAGYLYWGHMNPPWSVYSAFVDAYGEPSNVRETQNNLWRAIPIFRGRDFARNPKIELLYGDETLPRYNGATQTWEIVSNKLDATPRYGSAGFDVPTNVYTWTMAVFDGKLFVGTLDAGFGGMPTAHPGADLWFFKDGNSKAEAWTKTGFRHPDTVVGVRTMVPSNDTLFVGTSSMANLSPDGGWKLIGIKP